MCRKKKRFDQFARKKEITDRLTLLTLNWSPRFSAESPESAVRAEELRAILSDACASLKKIVLPRRDEQKIAFYAESILFEIDALERMEVAPLPEEKGLVGDRGSKDPGLAESAERTGDAVRRIADAILMWSREF